MPIIIALILASLAVIVALLMKCQTNKRLKSYQPEDVDYIEIKQYSLNAGMYIGLICIGIASAVVGYIVSMRAISIIAIIELLVCYLAVLAAAVIDLKTRTIPNYIPLALVVVRLLIFVYELIFSELAVSFFVSSLVGGLLCLLLLVIANKISKGGIGGGDIKLLSGVGFMCGLYVVFSTILLALICCIAVSAVMLIFKKCSTKDQVPFGPFIYVGYLVMCLLTLY